MPAHPHGLGWQDAAHGPPLDVPELRAFLIAALVPPYTAVAAAIGLSFAALTGSVGLLYRLGHAGVRFALFLAGTRIATASRRS